MAATVAATGSGSSSRHAQTPSRTRSLYTGAEKQSLLDNFDLEVNDRTRAFQASLSATLSSFKIRQETELMRIPRELRSLTLRELRERWGGSWKGTLLKLAKERVEKREKEFEDIKEGKRKRAAEAEADAPKAKNPRKESTKTVKRKVVKAKAIPATPSGPSTVPHSTFNPQLPPTPQFPQTASKPRALKRNESFFSMNGSPVIIAAGTGAAEEDDDELPDAEAMERAILASAGSPPLQSSSSSHSRGKLKKRAPSFMFRAAPAPTAVAKPATGDLRTDIALSDGRMLSFDPLNLSPGRIDAELEQGGLAEAEKIRVKGRVKEEVVRSLTEKMDRWKVL